jgi:hypothetical protein
LAPCYDATVAELMQAIALAHEAPQLAQFTEAGRMGRAALDAVAACPDAPRERVVEVCRDETIKAQRATRAAAGAVAPTWPGR